MFSDPWKLNIHIYVCTVPPSWRVFFSSRARVLGYFFDFDAFLACLSSFPSPGVLCCRRARHAAPCDGDDGDDGGDGAVLSYHVMSCHAMPCQEGKQWFQPPSGKDSRACKGAAKSPVVVRSVYLHNHADGRRVVGCTAATAVR